MIPPIAMGIASNTACCDDSLLDVANLRRTVLVPWLLIPAHILLFPFTDWGFLDPGTPARRPGHSRRIALGAFRLVTADAEKFGQKYIFYKRSCQVNVRVPRICAHATTRGALHVTTTLVDPTGRLGDSHRARPGRDRRLRLNPPERGAGHPQRRHCPACR